MASLEAVPGTPDGSVNSSTFRKEGPVLCFINKRLRSLKKKHNRILQIEENKSKGKTINKEQEDVLRSKVGVLTLIDELEKLKQPLSIAVKEEIAERERELTRRDEDNSSANEVVNSNANGETIENSEPDRNDVLPNGCSEETSKALEEGIIRNDEATDSLEGLLKFLYFAQLFHVTSHEGFASMMWTKMHERISCLSYDFVTEDATDHLKEEDLDALSFLGTLLTSRPFNTTISHKDALQNCLHHARQWLCNSDQPIHPDLPITYSGLRERLNRITSSEYFVMTPEIKILSQQAASVVAPDVSLYVPNVLLNQSSTEDEVLQMEGESNYFQYQNQIETEQQQNQKEEPSELVGMSEASDIVGDGNASSQYVGESSGSSEILQNEENRISTGVIHEQLHSPPQTLEQNEQQRPQQQNTGQQQQQQYYARNGGTFRSNQSHRGGRSMGQGGRGRGRGYINGRGNRGDRVSYSNGYGQYYDQGTQPRNYYGRRGRGSRGGGPTHAVPLQE
ncbi:uncharacterized protein LOC131033126 [Cryptomeria japonica]|uniref:uncharacterized protein LOC131033126 n=1 Tax=Cryptomeria japonica TaxID=3369 RepID=UPI0025ABE11C|nr:uncharacterized protein LOC131033126 [Cryptomeria japonica]XP_057820242.1 uncharacterized protein LOC131033126 [Cryptomeria japonica]XP_057820243.1 uncharacterized protein LOC131033126 [Cryptomeria japonica]XP_057820244.1 uncharacterized protein LOC131033126 [Cryptomeria japonica]